MKDLLALIKKEVTAWDFYTPTEADMQLMKELEDDAKRFQEIPL